MKLSEAMKLGSLMKPQGFGVLRNRDTWCAMDAGAEAAGVMYTRSALEAPWPWLYRAGRCPECGAAELRAVGVIASHLNDGHRWTRERIADWVATIEPAESADPSDVGRADAVDHACDLQGAACQETKGAR